MLKIREKDFSAWMMAHKRSWIYASESGDNFSGGSNLKNTLGGYGKAESRKSRGDGIPYAFNRLSTHLCT